MTDVDFTLTEEWRPAQEVLVKCKGFFLCEDFERKMELVCGVYYFLADVYEAVNDFANKENRDALGEVLKNDACFKHINSVLLHINFELYLPLHFMDFFTEIIKKQTQRSVSSKVEMEIGSHTDTVKTYFFEKIKADERIEVECNGKLSFKTKCYKECLSCFENLAFKLENSFFKYPNAASPDIFVTDLIHLHLRSHCFVVETTIEKNISELKKAFDASFYGKVIITINGKEQLFEKEADWSLVKSGETRRSYNQY
ncbi:MAG: hypothetical protein QM687_06305 [Ferruginibacter sp.]